MPIMKTVAFGRMWRYVCDGEGCEARHTTLADETMPDGWVIRVEDDKVFCPCCADLLTGPQHEEVG